MQRQSGNILHHAIQNNDISLINHIIYSPDIKTASQLARTVDDLGSLPIHLLEACHLSRPDKQKIHDKLINLMAMSELKPYSELLNIDEIEQQYASKDNAQLNNNLKLA